MSAINVYGQAKEKLSEIDLDDRIFGSDVKDHLIHDVVRMQMARKRRGSASTKTRSMVRGGGAKPWRQKGTGRARFGSSRNPIWRGGGVAFGPRNVRNFVLEMPKKARRLALFSCLSQKASDSKVFALDSYKADSPKTKDFTAMVKKLPSGRSLLIVLEKKDDVMEKSASNLPNVKTILVDYLNPHDLLSHDNIMFMEPSLKRAEEIFLK